LESLTHKREDLLD